MPRAEDRQGREGSVFRVLCLCVGFAVMAVKGRMEETGGKEIQWPPLHQSFLALELSAFGAGYGFLCLVGY